MTADREESRSPRSVGMARYGRTAVVLCCTWFVLFVGLPVLALFSSSEPGLLFGGQGREMIGPALALSLRTSLCATLLCALLGIPLGFALARFDFRGKSWLDPIVDIPLTLPPVVAGVALLMTYGQTGILHRWLGITPHLAFTTTAVILAQAFVACPFMVRAAQSGFGAVDPGLALASATLGARPWTTFCRIYVPLAAPALLSGATLTWARSLSEFGATLMFAGSFPGATQTMPLAVMAAMDVSLNIAVALSCVTVVLAAALLIASRALAGGFIVGSRDPSQRN